MMDADEWARLQELADRRSDQPNLYRLAAVSAVPALLDALDAAEARLAAVAQIIPRGAAESGGKATAEQVGYLRGMQHVHAQIRDALAGERMPG